ARRARRGAPSHRAAAPDPRPPRRGRRADLVRSALRRGRRAGRRAAGAARAARAPPRPADAGRRVAPHRGAARRRSGRARALARRRVDRRRVLSYFLQICVIGSFVVHSIAPSAPISAASIVNALHFGSALASSCVYASGSVASFGFVTGVTAGASGPPRTANTAYFAGSPCAVTLIVQVRPMSSGGLLLSPLPG